VLGAGSWGTALAIQFARAGRRTFLWGRDAELLAQLARERCNRRYLPDAPFPAALTIEAHLHTALGNCQDILVAVPSHALRSTLSAVAPLIRENMRLTWATKGFELHTGLLPHQIAAEVLATRIPVAVISGPTFAREVGAGLPTAITVAASDERFARALATSLSDNNFRVYTSTDVIGVEVGGAVKNVLAIGAGMSDGLGFGANTRIALITRGLVEMTRLGVALGAQRETFMGLAGLGDLVLTCTDNLSRNRRFGLAMAAGQNVTQAQKEIGQVVEGVQAAQAVHEVAQRLQVEMPICEQVYAVLYKQIAPAQAVKQLMSRELKSEA
jgi:glycerol-3-phosphate dehydrogenase (NAD(P)+)